jgi:hypothetical protein
MMKISESVIKVVTNKKRKWLIRFNQKVIKAGGCCTLKHSVTDKLFGRKQASKLAYSLIGNVETQYYSFALRTVYRKVNYSNAGLGCWNKRMLSSNSSDTSCNITRHESEPTSNRSFIVREFEESIL